MPVCMRVRVRVWLVARKADQTGVYVPNDKEI